MLLIRQCFYLLLGFVSFSSQNLDCLILEFCLSVSHLSIFVNATEGHCFDLYTVPALSQEAKVSFITHPALLHGSTGIHNLKHSILVTC